MMNEDWFEQASKEELIQFFLQHLEEIKTDMPDDTEVLRKICRQVYDLWFTVTF